MLLDSYRGQLLVAQPKCVSSFFKETVVLVVRHGPQGAWGVIVNQQIPDRDCCLADILKHVGMSNDFGIDAPLYVGGPLERNRVAIVHSSDWASASTLEITEDLSVTTDLSILAALAGGQGPANFRACCGISSWAPGQLEGEMRGEEPWSQSHRWLNVPATHDKIFNVPHELQWQTNLAEAITQDVKEWF